VHLFELGASLERVRLVGVTTEADVVERVAARAATTPKGEWIKAGFQIAVHAIGDAANTAVLDFFESAARAIPASASARHRIEHAQVVARADITRFATLGIIASMQPSHAVEDMPWAGARLGPLRVEGSYAWRTLRQAGARLVFSSDLPGTDYDFFYGLHSAVTRQDREGTPAGGWRPEERVTVEEALRGASENRRSGDRPWTPSSVSTRRLHRSDRLTALFLAPLRAAGCIRQVPARHHALLV
jgi:predicted amidohydrolase YtcJ